MNNTKHIVEWKPIMLFGKESCYEINNYGQVRNINTNLYRVPSKSKNGYYHVILYANGMSKSISIHRLVAQYFVYNDSPSTKTQVDHIDGCKDHNYAWNLEWVTPAENTKRAIEKGLTDPRFRNQQKGAGSGVSKHTVIDAHNVCKLLELGLSNKEIADKLHIGTEFVRSIRRGQAWKYISASYKIPKPEKRQYYSDDFRNKARKLILSTSLSDLEIAIIMKLPNPNLYGRKYINKLRSRLNQDRSSTTIPLATM